MKAKFVTEKISEVLMLLASLSVLAFFAGIMYTILRTGIPTLTWSMVSELPGGGFFVGEDGGLLNAIAGSLIIVGASTVLGLVISIPVVFYLNVYLTRKSRRAFVIRLGFDVLYGIPSIVYGAFAFTLMILLGMKTSLLGGILVVTILIIPIFVRSMDEMAVLVSHEMLDAVKSMGATRWETGKVVLRQILPGIVTATLLSIGRAIGDSAGVMLTTGFTDNIPTSLDQPAATLPLAVFFQLSSPIPEVREKAYAAALILTLIVLVLSLSARMITAMFNKNRIK